MGVEATLWDYPGAFRDVVLTAAPDPLLRLPHSPPSFVIALITCTGRPTSGPQRAGGRDANCRRVQGTFVLLEGVVPISFGDGWQHFFLFKGTFLRSLLGT